MFRQLLSSYNSFNEYGFDINENYPLHKEFRKILFEEEINKLLEQKHLLGLISANFDKILFNIKEIVTNFVKSKKYPYLNDLIYPIMCFQLPTSDRVKILALLGKFFLNKLPECDFREYAPPLENPRLPFNDTISFNPVNMRISRFVAGPGSKIETFNGATAGKKITVLPRRNDWNI